MAGKDAARKRNERQAANDLEIPAVKNPDRRAECEADDKLWLRTYKPDVFYNPFSGYHERIIEDCALTLQYGLQKCKAAERGGGKSSIIKYLALKYALTRKVRFPLIIAATGDKAKKTLDSVQKGLASRISSPLIEDYPLECLVARYVDPSPVRARNVTANKLKPISVEWGAKWFTIPTWAEQESLGPIFLSLGWTSDDLQGCNILDQRPDFVMLDDLDSRDSLAAEDGGIAEKIEQVIDKTVAGMGGQSRGCGKFMLCTITSRTSAAFKYSDPKVKASWSGERVKAIEKWPDNPELWREYIELRQWGQTTFDDGGRPVDEFGRKAHEHYLAHREEMDAGAILANPYNYERQLLPDSTQKQVSALQRCYDFIADHGMEAFLTEFQQEPPQDETVTESALTPAIIIKRVNGYDRRVVPDGCSLLTQGMDAKKQALHWVVRAWEVKAVDDHRKDSISYLVAGHTIDYGVQEVTGTMYGSDEGVAEAVRAAVKARMEAARVTEYKSESGELFNVDLTCIDARWKTDAIYSACLEIGTGIMPVMGCGKSSGCTRTHFTPIQKSSVDRRPGDNWYQARERIGDTNVYIWVTLLNADFWKQWEHDRWLTAVGKPGAMQIFGIPHERKERLSADQSGHHSYSRHICNEKEVERVRNGVMKRVWEAKGPNHWLDASAYCDLAANLRGVRLATAAAAKVQPKRERISLADMAKGRR